MEKKQICAFTGLRPEKLPVLTDTTTSEYAVLRTRIKNEVIRLITEENVGSFLCGMAKGIDLICGRIVLELKEQYPDITLEAVIPYEKQAAAWNENDREEYFDVAEHCDKETMLQTQYTNGCLQKRNRYLVDNADIVLAVWNGTSGGTAYTVSYAQKKGKTLVIINPDEPAE